MKILKIVKTKFGIPNILSQKQFKKKGILIFCNKIDLNFMEFSCLLDHYNQKSIYLFIFLEFLVKNFCGKMFQIPLLL